MLIHLNGIHTNLLKLPTPTMNVLIVSDEETEQSEQFVRHTGQNQRPHRFQEDERVQTKPVQIRPTHDQKTHPHCCECCGKRFRYGSGLRQHQTSHSSKREYACSTCPAAFKFPWNLQYHQKGHQKKGAQICPEFMCPECGRVFKNELRLNRHRERIHEKPSSLVCDKCGKTFSTKDSLRAHYNIEHT